MQNNVTFCLHDVKSYVLAVFTNCLLHCDFASWNDRKMLTLILLVLQRNFRNMDLGIQWRKQQYIALMFS